jgi:hypothetical protein
VDLLLADLLLADLLLVGLHMVGQMVLLVVPHKCTFLVRALFPLVVLSIRMEHALFYQYRLCLVGLVGLVLLPDIALHRRYLHAL